LGMKTNNQNALVLADALDRANGKYLDNAKSPSSKVNELDNRGSHFYLALYWAEELAAQDHNPQLKNKFAALNQALSDQEAIIIAELTAAQGQFIDIGGYYHLDKQKANQAMRPSATLNQIIS
jgi:isocitrate dehydrogenase